jgi:DNA sulfur modification protein DndD
MELHRLELTNFRQFENESMAFAKSPDAGVTVVHGANGSGKTTLLNAFTWLLYGEVDFDTRPERLVTEGVIAGAAVGAELTVSVSLEFKHEGRHYLAEREARYEKRSQSDLDGQLQDVDVALEYNDGGNWSERGNPENSLDQIMPERLSSLFFFDGEDIEELAGIDNQQQIQSAIQNIMGLTILERATRHLDHVAGEFEDEVEQHASEELSKLIKQKRTTEEKIEECERDRDDAQRSIDRIETEIRDIEQKLERLDESAALQEQRNEYQEKRSKLEDEVETINQNIKDELNSKGFIPLAMPLIRETAEQLDEMRREGRIPSDLTDSYIQSLLETNQCICGRSLEEDSKQYRRVEALKGDAISEGVEQSAIRIIGNLNQMSDKESEFFDEVDEYIRQRKERTAEIETLTEKIDEISSELQKMDQTTESGESITELESKREQKTRKKEELLDELGKIKERIDRHEEEIESIKADIDKQRDERQEALVAKRRQRAAESVREELNTAFSELKNKVRRLSNKKIQRTFDEIASKDMQAEITEDFELRIWQEVDGDRIEVDKSTGERQIASLAFISSLVDIARERYEADTETEYFTGGVYPLVMDSPFGALDKSHRRQVGRIVPQLANQVVVFATDSQWEGPVEEEMGPNVGKQYWLDFNEQGGSGSYPQTRIRTEQIPAGERQ